MSWMIMSCSGYTPTAENQILQAGLGYEVFDHRSARVEYDVPSGSAKGPRNPGIFSCGQAANLLGLARVMLSIALEREQTTPIQNHPSMRVRGGASNCGSCQDRSLAVYFAAAWAAGVLASGSGFGGSFPAWASNSRFRTIIETRRFDGFTGSAFSSSRRSANPRTWLT